jgi:hypothetical protein
LHAFYGKNFTKTAKLLNKFVPDAVTVATNFRCVALEYGGRLLALKIGDCGDEIGSRVGSCAVEVAAAN